MTMYRAITPSIYALSTSLRVGSWRMAPSRAPLARVGRGPGGREHLVVPVDRERPVLERGLDEVEQVLRVHLARVVRDGRRQVDRADNADAAAGPRPPRPRPP